MTILTQFILAIAVVAAAGLIAYALSLHDMPEVDRPTHARRTPPAPHVGNCSHAGHMVTTSDRVRLTIEFVNELTLRGDMRGDRVDPQRIEFYVRAWAADQASPECVLAITNMCSADYRKTYAQGFQLVTEALVREAVRRRRAAPTNARVGACDDV